MQQGSWICSLILDVLGGVLAGAILAIGALWRARVPNISGVWTLTTTIQRSAWNPYKELQTTYLVMLSQNGTTLDGVAEKVYEVRRDGSRHEYIGHSRKKSEVSGGLSGNVFQRKTFQLIFREEGLHRTFVSTHSIEKKEHDDMWSGSFVSTAANSSGTTKWIKGIGKYNFSLKEKENNESSE